MKRLSICLAVCVLAAFAAVNAQDGTVVRVDYVTVLVHADGTEAQHSEGVRYIAADGRYRHDETVAGRAPTSVYRLPADGVNVSVNHSLVAAVRSGLVPPVNFAAPIGTGFGAAPIGLRPTDIGLPPTVIGERTLGPLLLRGFAQDQEGFGRTEFWVYEHPLMQTAPNPIAYPPIVVEMTIFENGGERLEVRATSVRRVPLEADTFVVPNPVP